jgi:hypothetical protein
MKTLEGQGSLPGIYEPVKAFHTKTLSFAGHDSRKHDARTLRS